MFNNCRGTRHRAQMKNHAKSIANNVGFGQDRTEKGITLIALVVTIIVLLILAAVSLNLVAGSDGLLNRASSAVDATTEASAKEQAELLAINYKAEFYDEKYVQHNNNLTNAGAYLASQTASGQTAGGYYIQSSGTTAGSSISVYKDSNKNVTYANGIILENGSINWGAVAPAVNPGNEGPGEEPVANTVWTQSGDDITNGTVTIKVGDYVDYDPTKETTNTTYTSLAAKTGWDNDQVFNVATYKSNGYGWRVFGVEDGKILIISEDCIGPDTGGMVNSTYGNTYYYLKGVAGYQNGISELNKIGDLFGHGKNAIGGRSINVEDVKRIAEYEPSDYVVDSYNGYGVEVTYYWDGTDVPSWVSSNNSNAYNNKLIKVNKGWESGFYWFDTNSIIHYSAMLDSVEGLTDEERKIATLKNTLFSCSISINENLSEVEKELLLGVKDDKYYFSNSGSDLKYWVASNYVLNHINNPEFGLYHIYGGSTGSAHLYSNRLVSSQGDEDGYATGIRPVIYLERGVTLEWNSEQDRWDFVE